jgi:signal transduction histidine kinase
MSFLQQALVFNIFSMLILISVSMYLYNIYRHSWLKIWTFAWIFYIGEFSFGMAYTASPATTAVQKLIEWGFCMSALMAGTFFVLGTYGFLGKKTPYMLLSGVGLLGFWGLPGQILGFSDFVQTMPGVLFLAAAITWCGILIFKRSENHSSENVIAGTIIIVWGLHHISFPFFIHRPFPLAVGFLVNAGLEITIAISLVMIYFRDLISDLIVARKNLEQANEELLEIDQLKTNFLSNISHELRTPLAAIKGYLQLTMTKQNDEDPIKEWIRIAHNSCRRLDFMIGQLLDTAMLQSKKINFTFEPIEMPQLIDSCLDILKPQLEGASCRISRDYAEDLPLVKADKDHMTSIILNLLGNALKFSEQSNEISISAQKTDNHKVQVAVIDQGIGISEQYHDKIFDRFFQVDSSSTRIYGGSGIGLALVKELIEAHDGEVWLNSEVGKGSAFYFTIPQANSNTSYQSEPTRKKASEQV